MYSSGMADEKPKQYGEPQRSIRVSKPLWEAAQEQAYQQRTSVNAAVALFLAEWAGHEPDAGSARMPEPAKTEARAAARQAISKLPSMR